MVLAYITVGLAWAGVSSALSSWGERDWYLWYQAAGAMALARRMGRTPVLLRKEISGFVVNRILAAIMDEAIRLYEGGIASFEDIDTAVKKGLRHPMGPFELMDFNGIDVAYNVRMQRYRETGDELQKPARSIEERYGRGEWGRKTGKGWYAYPRPEAS